MLQLVYDLFNKNGGRFKTLIMFSMELFVTIGQGFWTVAVVEESYLVDEAGFMGPFPEKYIAKIKIDT